MLNLFIVSDVRLQIPESGYVCFTGLF